MSIMGFWQIQYILFHLGLEIKYSSLDLPIKKAIIIATIAM